MFLQGNLYALARERVTGLAVGRVEQDVDEHGTYRPWFTVVTASGIRIRVIVTPEDTP
jgi:hypothetical protein